MGDFGNCEDFMKNNGHSKTIIHIDIDCFYAQVEILKNPSLRNKPVGVKQKNYVITSNYIARGYGIKKCMFITDAIKLCPSLVLVNGEDLHDYKQMSSNVTDIVKTFSDKVEKLGLDENFVDVTDIVFRKMNDRSEVFKTEGHIYNNIIETDCNCGCSERLRIGSVIAKEIRDKIRNQLGLSCCAGISYNKLLAKLVTSANKPDQQTVVFPSTALNLIQNLGNVGRIPGVGFRTCEILNSLGISSVTDLQNFPLKILEKHLLKSNALKLKKASFGIDDDDVKTSGKPQSISLEDACRKLTSIEEVSLKLHSLVQRLLVLIKEDGRQPTTARVTVRKYNQCDRQQTRESKQCSISAEWFKKPECFSEKIVNVFVELFHKLVDVSKPFHLTLIGITVTKFFENVSPKKSIVTFFQKSQLLQDNEDDEEKLILTQEPEKRYELNVSAEESDKQFLASSSRQKEFSLENTDVKNSWVAIECPKGVDEKVFHELPRSIQDELIMYSSFLLQNGDKTGETTFSENPHKPEFSACNSEQTVNTPGSKPCPIGIDEQVFMQLPSDIQDELIQNLNACDYKKPCKNSKQNSIERYFSKVT